MLITFGQAKQRLVKVSGLQTNHPDLADLINLAVEQLMNSSTMYEGTRTRMRFCVNNSSLTMPREVLMIAKVCADEVAANVFNRWYEFLGYGPGTLDNNASGYVDLADLGDGFALHTDPNEAKQMMIITDSASDASARSVLIRGLDENGLEVRQNGELGEHVPIDYLHPRFSVNKFSQISQIVKPVTKGYIYLSSYDPATGARINLGTYHPDETTPSFRRYYVTGVSATECATVTAMARLRFVPMTHDSDPVLIQNLPALEYQIQAIRQFRATNMENGLKYQQLATQQLDGQLAAVNGKQNQIDFEPNWASDGVRGVM